MKRIMISAGEVSGDTHGKYLVRELKKLDSSIYFFGMGSEQLRSEGVDIKVDITKRGTVGIFEALPNVLPVFLAYRKMAALMKQTRPDLVIFIDSQGINLPLAKAARKLRLKTVYYIAPQEWLWGSPTGVKNVAQNVDQLISIWQPEHDIYRQAGGNSVYYGHTLLDIVKPILSREAARKKFLGSSSGPVISLCPGSRTQEIRTLFPILLEAGKIIQKEIPQAKFLIAAAYRGMLKEAFGFVNDFHPQAIVGQTYDILNASDLALCTSGTINLEASILGVPNIMVYKLSPLTYWVGKNILKIDQKMKYFSMPNILLDEPALPELVMDRANPEAIAKTSLALLGQPAQRVKMLKALGRLRSLLGRPGAIARTAQEILNC